jgi:agmatinase
MIMRLAPDCERLLLRSVRIPNFVPDEYDVDISMIVKDWREAEECDVGILGIPFDTATVSRRGSRWGPQGVRNGLVQMTSYEPGLDVDLRDGIRVVDFGDVDVVHTNLRETHSRVEAVVNEICRRGIIPLIIGGDHGLSYPVAKGLCNAVDGNVGVIYFDAHPDLRLARHGEVSSGTAFRRMLDELPSRQIRPENMVAVGIGGWHNARVWIDHAKSVGMHIVTAREIHRHGIEDVMQQALRWASSGVTAIHVSVDVDCLDAAFAPGTNVPAQGGLSSFQLLEGVFIAGRSALVRSFDLMEVAPPLDSANVTSFVGASILMQFLGAVQSRRASKIGELKEGRRA